MFKFLQFVFATVLLSLSPTLFAHNFGEGGHLIIALDDKGNPEMQFDLTTGEMNKRFVLDTNKDDKLSLTEEEVYPAPALIEYIYNHLSISFDAKPCAYEIINHRLMMHGNGNYVRFLLNHQCPTPKYEIAANYNLLFNENPKHMGSMHLTRGDAMIQMRFFEDQRQQAIELQEMSIDQTIIDFIIEGTWHIWIGIDHILFLVCLILPAVLFLQNGRWQARESLREVLIEALKIVTAFTIAHSITLVSAVLGWVELPPARITESIIALSVLVVALNCIYPRMDKSLWLLTFAFGLIHGFGFANVLLELSLPPTATTIALIAFNVGVELGQLAIVIAVLPLLYLVRTKQFYQPIVLKGGSYVVSLIAVIWLVERAVAIDIVSFV